MNRRHFLSMLPLLVGGCAFDSAARPWGESASYALFSASHEKSYQMADLMIDEGFLDERYDVPALPPGAPGWNGGGLFQSGFNGHRVPERVWVSWRLMPRADQQHYNGDLVGPFEVALRSQIPEEVLLELGNPTVPRRLEVAVSVGVLPVRVRWRLVSVSKSKELVPLRRGGDWRLPAPGE
jgi:hypothetical protein